MRKTLVTILICSAGAMLLAGCSKEKLILEKETNNDKTIEVGELISLTYHPGYADEEGGRHNESLTKTNDGEWIIECLDQETHDEPATIKTYAVSDDDVERFEAFIKDNNVLALTDRKDSDDFVTDYSPWSYSIIFENSSIGGDDYETFSIDEFKKYSDADSELLKKLRKQFESLRGEVISETVEGDEDDPEQEDEPKTETRNDTDYESEYAPVFDEVLEVLDYGFNMDKEYKYVSGGLSEKVMYSGDDDLLNSIGYLMTDLSGDGVPELLIGSDEEYDGRRIGYIYTLCTIIDDEPVCVLFGSTRSSYNYLGDGHFYYEGSGGVAITIFGENHLSKDGSELVWDDFYFTDEKEDGNIGIYYNDSGIFGVEESEELNMSEKEFRSKMSSYQDRCEMISWIPIGNYRIGGGKSSDEKSVSGKSTRIQYYQYSEDDAEITKTKVTLHEVSCVNVNDEDDEGPMDLIVDEDTVFDRSCDMEAFPWCEKGDSPLEWYNRVKELKDKDPEHYMADGPALIGVFEVEITGRHIDKYYGSYWWD